MIEAAGEAGRHEQPRPVARDEPPRRPFGGGPAHAPHAPGHAVARDRALLEDEAVGPGFGAVDRQPREGVGLDRHGEDDRRGPRGGLRSRMRAACRSH